VVAAVTGNVTVIDPFGPLTESHTPAELKDPHDPVKTSISNPGALSTFAIVIVAEPLVMAETVNHTLLFTVKSPQLKAGSLMAAVAPTVLAVTVLFMHKGLALEQLSCADKCEVMHNNMMSVNKFRILIS